MDRAMTTSLGTNYWSIRIKTHINGLVQDCSNSCVLAVELLQSCTKPSIYFPQRNGIENIYKMAITLSLKQSVNTLRPRDTTICVCELEHYWLRQWLVACVVPSHSYLNLSFCQLGPWEEKGNEISKYENEKIKIQLSVKKLHLKCCLQNVSCFIPASKC